MINPYEADFRGADRVYSNRTVEPRIPEPPTVSSVLAGDLGGISLDRPRVIVDVNLLLVRDEQVLLGRRHNTEFGNGTYGPPAGHLELGESVVAAIIREAKEEIGICVKARDLELAHVMHNSYGIGRIALFFEARAWRGQVTNMEPEKCDDLRWFGLDQLPENMMPHIRRAFDAYRGSTTLSLYGW